VYDVPAILLHWSTVQQTGLIFYRKAKIGLFDSLVRQTNEQLVGTMNVPTPSGLPAGKFH
jgi:hypothetical protein